jgi:arginase
MAGGAERRSVVSAAAEHRDFDRVFRLLDANGDGVITRREVEAALEVLGRAISTRDRAGLLELVDGHGRLTRDAFVGWMAQRQDIDVMADLREVFQLIDADGSGKLSVDEFTQIISCLDTLLGADAVAALIRSADRDGDGEIDFDEFIRTQVSTSALRVSVVALRTLKKTLLQYRQVAESSSVVLVEVDSELGAGRRGQAGGPASLRDAALQKQSALMRAENGVLSRDSLRVQTANWAQGAGYRHRHAKYIDKLHRVLGDTRDLVADALRAGHFPIVLGGDHSTAAGTIAGIKTAFPHRRLGVVWIDAHADIHSPHTTPSGNMHGMPVAIATATDNLAERINDVDADTLDLWARCKALGVAHGANVSLDDLVYVAVRDTEKAEDHLIETHAIMNLTTDTVRALGAEGVARRCLDRLEGVDLIYVTFDVDSMDATICMGTGTPSPHGIFLEEARLLNETLVRDPRVCCWEICEINPLLDVVNTTVENSLAVFQAVVDTVVRRLGTR